MKTSVKYLINEILEHLAQAVELTGHTVTRDESFFTVEPINLKIKAEIGDRNEYKSNGKQSVVLTISIKATHEQMFPGGIWDRLAGFGKNDEEAFSYAARRNMERAAYENARGNPILPADKLGLIHQAAIATFACNH